MSDRVVLVAAELNLTTTMLELPAVPSFAEVRQEPLAFFTHAREDVRGCVSASPKALPRASSAAPVLAAALRGCSLPSRSPCRWILRISPRAD